jgi:Flp pilus assembly protein TadB
MSSGALAFFIFSMKPEQAGGSAVAANQGFDVMGWVAPIAVFVAALLGSILLVRRWSANKRQNEVQGLDPAMDGMNRQIRRETGIDGGF